MGQTSFFRSSAGVFQGGGCRAAAFVGAYEEAINRGVSFVEVAGTSAGSIVAALIGAGGTPAHLHEMIGTLDFKSFLTRAEPGSRQDIVSRLVRRAFPEFGRLLIDQGFYSSTPIANWTNQQLNKLLPHVPHPVTFRSLPVPTYIVSTDLIRTEAKIWSQSDTPNELVAAAVQASCAIPIFFQPVDRRYVDGGVLSNLPGFVFSHSNKSDSPLSTKVLAFSLSADDEPSQKWDVLQFLRLLASAIVDGSQKLQLDQQRTIHVISIPTGQIKATDFDVMSPKIVQELIENGRKATSEFFDEELQHVLAPRPAALTCSGADEVYTHVTDGLELSLARAVICEHNTNWVYSLFPTLLCWRLQGTQVDVVLPQYGDKEGDGQYRRKLLKALGARVTELEGVSSAPIRAYVLDTVDPSRIKAIVGVETGQKTHGVDSVVYSGSFDRPAISSILERIDAKMKPWTPPTRLPKIVAGAQESLIELLSGVGQYSREGVTLAIEEVRLDRLKSLTKLVREYKYKQIQHLIARYVTAGLSLFLPSYVAFLDGQVSLLTPPVVEESGSTFVLIEAQQELHIAETGVFPRL